MSIGLVIFYYIFLTVIWSLSYIFMRVGVPQVGVYVFVGLRVGIAGLVLLPLLLTPKRIAEIKSNWLSLSFIGILSTGLPFVFYSYAALTLSAGITSVINASVPMFTGVIAHIFFNEHLNKRQLIGLVIGMLGVLLLMFDKLLEDQWLGSVISVLSALLACLCYAVSGPLVKRYFDNVSPITTAGMGLIVSGLLLLPLVIINFPKTSISWQAWGSVIGIAVFSTAIGMLIFYILLKEIGTIKTVTITFILPIFAIFWGILLLDEILTINMIIGTLVILTGAFLTIFNKK